MQKKILAVIAHPDDESFGLGGTLVKYASEGVEIHVLCATRGENGRGGSDLGKTREKELLTASKILGVARVDFMDYIDGTLSNGMYQAMAAKIEAKIKTFQPQVVLTFDRLGVSGHIDHIMVAMVTTFVCKKYQDQLKLYYYCELKETTDKVPDYFIYFPEGYEIEDVDVCIDTKAVWEIKVKAMWAHQSQKADVEMILEFTKDLPRQEYFIEAFKKTKGHELRTDFFGA